ncbi:uncharacterized protein LOC141826488 [Curcuma longa]|uniref:uncharacterized protein LOC141826488 n=1 Tax=Curcuma longa TaxID=136217 RepID=UPI003D9EB58D
MQFDRHSPDSSPSLMHRFRSSICGSCCFGGGGGVVAGDEEGDRPASLVRSSTIWLRSKAQELPEIGGRCRNLVARIGRHQNGSRGPCAFRYDPLSYALNFDEGAEDEDMGIPTGGDGHRYRNFSSRLPLSPPRRSAGVGVEVAS